MRGCVVLAVFGVCVIAAISPAFAKDKPGAVPSADACAEVIGSVRSEAYGYTHVVTLRNGCPKAILCQLWTDVDPEPRVGVELGVGESTEVVTRRGSPARDVRAYKKCSFR